MDPNTKVFPPYRLVAEYGDGSRLLFYHALAPQPPVIDIFDFTELIIPDDNEEE